MDLEERIKNLEEQTSELKEVQLDMIEHIQLDGSGFDFEDSIDYGNDKTFEWQKKLRGKDGDSKFSVTITPSGILNASKIILPKIIENGLKEMEKDGEIDVEEMSNKNLCREESNNDILPSSKPYEPLLKKDAVIELEEKCKDCLAHQFDEEFGHMCISPLCIEEYDYDIDTRIWTPKEPIDDLKHKHQYDFNYDCVECGKNLLEIIERGFLTTEFDSHNTHKIVQKVALEGWKSKVQNYTSDNSIDSYNRLFSIIQEIDQYLGEVGVADEM